MPDDAMKKALKLAIRRYRALLDYGGPHLGVIRDVVTESNLAELRELLPPDLLPPIEESVAQQPALKGVGYWSTTPTEANSDFPHPTSLGDPKWRTRDRQRIIAYLKAGSVYVQWRGRSFCRFSCRIGSSDMGSRCLTDGVWVWPEGLAHYIEAHDVRLPDEFVETMQAHDWRIPKRAEEVNRERYGDPRCAFWIEWARRATA